MSIVASEWRYQHKAGQLRSMQCVTWILLATLLATIYAAHDLSTLVSTPPIEEKDGRVLVRSIPSLLQQDSTGVPSRSYGGVLINYRIVSDTPSVSMSVIPYVGVPAPALASIGVPPSMPLVAGDFEYTDPLPPAPRMPIYRTPPRIQEPSATSLEVPARLVMPSIEWPKGIQLPITDTPFVTGHITLHFDGHVTFVMHKQSHAGLSFDIAVNNAVQKAICNPALNYRGAKISVVAPYRVVFKRTAASITSTSTFHGSIYNDYH